MTSKSSFYEGNTAGDTNFRRSWKTQYLAASVSAGGLPKANQAKTTTQEDLLVQSHQDQDLNLEANLNKTTVVETITAGQKSGYYCAVCDYTAKDSSTYLDHINSKWHQRNLGVSLRVERSTVEQVKARIEFWKRKLKEPEEDFSTRVDRLQKEEMELKLKQKELKKAKKLKRIQEVLEAEKQEKLEQASLKTAEEEDMAALMGFSSFDSSKK